MAEIPKAGAHGLRCVVCRTVRDGPTIETGRPGECVCFKCAQGAAEWLKRWGPVVRRYERTGKLYVRPSEWKGGQP